LTNRCIEEVKQVPDSEPGKAWSTKLNRLSEIARQEPKVRFTSLAHLVDEGIPEGKLQGAESLCGGWN